MKKRVLSALLGAALVLALSPAAGAKAADVPEREKAVVLRELEIMVGDESGDLALDRAVTRAEFTKMLVAASPYKGSVGESADTDPYPDVSHTAWYAPYVRAAVDAGLVKGDLAGYFQPGRNIDLREGATMAVRLLGYQDSQFAAPWPTGQLALYRSLGLDEGVTVTGGTELLSRRDCLHLFYNLLTVPNASGTAYINLLGHTLNQQGEVDVSALFQVEREGPIPLTGNWQELLPFDAADALLYRDNARAQWEELREWDLLYWAKDQAILFATSSAQNTMNQMSAAVEGPIPLEGDWSAKLPFPLSEVRSVTRNGYDAALSDLRQGDLVYYSKYAKGLYVYAKTVAGTVEAISPSLAAPSAVTVAGNRYSLETFEAQYAFSDLGAFRKGDPVRLLLGRNGGVAAVRVLEEDPAPVVGVLTALTEQNYTDRNDDPYTARAVTVTALDGTRYTYPYAWEEDTWETGALVAVTAGWGETHMVPLEERSAAGKFSADMSALGKLPVASDVTILDCCYSAVTALPPTRLAGVSLEEKNVRYYTTNEEGEIDALVLRDVSGELHTFGVLTDVTALDTYLPGVGFVLQSTYTLDVGGQSQVFTVSGKQFAPKDGPVLVETDGLEVKSIRRLSQLSGVTLGERSITVWGQKYTLSDRVGYYIYDPVDERYTLASRTQVLGGEYVLSAWYDAPDAQGGRVRILVGTPRNK